MSKADEMFEKLGYEKEVTEQSETYYLGKEKFIKFWLWAKNIQINEINQLLNIQELQAINEKVKELGWNESN